MRSGRLFVSDGGILSLCRDGIDVSGLGVLSLSLLREGSLRKPHVNLNLLNRDCGESQLNVAGNCLSSGDGVLRIHLCRLGGDSKRR